MKYIFIIFFVLVVTVVYVASGGKGERDYYPGIGSLEYINDAKICAVYYKLIDDKYDDAAKAELSAFEAAFWERKTKKLGMTIESARDRIKEELDGYMNKMDDPELRQDVGAKKLILRALANNRGCSFIVVSGQKNLISEVEAGSR